MFAFFSLGLHVYLWGKEKEREVVCAGVVRFMLFLLIILLVLVLCLIIAIDLIIFSNKAFTLCC